MIADAAEHPIVITIEDGIREGGVGSMAADAISAHVTDATPPRVRVLGIPKEYLDHAKTDAILLHVGLHPEAPAHKARAQVSALRAYVPNRLDLPPTELGIALARATFFQSLLPCGIALS